MEAPTVVRLLKDPESEHQPQQLGIATDVTVDLKSEVLSLKKLLQAKPNGPTKLIPHLREVVDSILAIPQNLLENRSIALVVVTDSLPTGQTFQSNEDACREFLETLFLLEDHSVWVVICLCTDEAKVVDYYNDLDARMAHVSSASLRPAGQKIHFDVLDDYVSESAKVYEHNPWLNYAYPLHLCRESAVNFPVFDALNDRPLCHQELADFVALVFDRTHLAWADQPLPNPKTDYNAFRQHVDELVTKNGRLWNPVRRRVLPWIDMKAMDRIYGTRASKAVRAGVSSSCACTVL
jgi:hypothetical protein